MSGDAIITTRDLNTLFGLDRIFAGEPGWDKPARLPPVPRLLPGRTPAGWDVDLSHSMSILSCWPLRNAPWRNTIVKPGERQLVAVALFSACVMGSTLLGLALHALM